MQEVLAKDKDNLRGYFIANSTGGLTILGVAMKYVKEPPRKQKIVFIEGCIHCGKERWEMTN